MRIDSMNLGQRIVLVVASGLVLLVFAWWIVTEDAPGGGWFGYAPDVAVLHSTNTSRFSTAIVAFVYEVAVVVWAVIALRLLRDRPSPPTDQDPAGR